MRAGKWLYLEAALAVGLASVLLAGSASLRTQSELADRVVRLHVLANSDSEEDQSLKLLVRDQVLQHAAGILEGAEDRRSAESLLREALPDLEEDAARVVEANGYDYPVTAELADADFPTKEYQGFALPAGRYLALRISIGQGAGRNWWCVVFPPLCTAASAQVAETALASGLTEEQVGLITEEDQGYVLKFKAVEWWDALRERFDQGK